jgi:ADP-heptose:LPS heptosyltransferase
MDLVITGDPFTILLACAVQTPVIGIYGPVNPYRYGPIGTRYMNVHCQIPCFPCRKYKRCRIGYGCLDSVETDQVLSDARLILDTEKQLYLF